MRLHYRKYGSGSPLIILHGLLGSLANWHRIASELGAHWTVFTLDQRNHGHSPHSEIFTYDAMVEDLVDFMDAKELASAHLLGHSMGGKTAMVAATRFPSRISTLIVADIAPRSYEGIHDELLDAMVRLDLNTFSSREEIDATLAFEIPSDPVRQFLMMNLRRTSEGAYHWRVNLETLRSSYEEIIGRSVEGGTFPGRTLFLRGEKSDYVSEGDYDRILALFPRAIIRTVAGAGHWIHADAPGEFVTIVQDFLMKKTAG